MQLFVNILLLDDGHRAKILKKSVFVDPDNSFFLYKFYQPYTYILYDNPGDNFLSKINSDINSIVYISHIHVYSQPYKFVSQ